MQAKQKDFLKVVLVLCLIAVASGALIGGFYLLTLVDEEAETIKAISESFPELENITRVELTKPNTISVDINADTTYGTVKRVFVSDDNTYVIQATGTGAYDGELTLLVAIKDNVIVKIATYEANETPGVGSRALPPEGAYIGQFEGANISEFDAFTIGGSGSGSAKRWLNPVLDESSQAVSTTDGTVVTVTGATRSSTAVLNAINVAVKAYKTINGGN